MNKKGIWAKLRAIATEPGITPEGETERGMAIVALKAAYAYLLKAKKENDGVGGKVPQRSPKSMDKKKSP